MNSVDLALALLLLLCALRGYWRGIFREGFGLIALAAGVVTAALLTPLATVTAHEYLHLPPWFETGMIFVGIFVLVHTVVNLSGVVFDRLARGLPFRVLSRMAGAALGVLKGAAVLAFVLLFFHLSPVLPKLDAEIMSSAVGRPLVNAAGDIVRLGSQGAPQPGLKRKA
jgi:uncharacterized membrane protein required for colicin V production